jgi:hypothetical protein
MVVKPSPTPVSERVNTPSCHSRPVSEYGFNLNGLTVNGFNLNGLTVNGFTLNGFTVNGVNSGWNPGGEIRSKPVNNTN